MRHRIDSSDENIFRAADVELDLRARGLVMGILNVTVDSFSDGGKHLSPDDAVAHGRRMISEGADIIDVGGESTRPGAEPVPEAVELARVLPVIARLAAESQTLLSVDTSKPAVARQAVAAGAKIINDVAGLREPGMLEVARETGAGVIAMHMRGTPRDMQLDPRYEDVVREVGDFFRLSLERFLDFGLDRRCVAFDPGIGFGKTLAHNLELLNRLEALAVGGRPLVIGVSRKSFIGKVLGDASMERRRWPTVALTAALRERGARIFRVHDVRENVDALRMMEAILEGAT